MAFLLVLYIPLEADPEGRKEDGMLFATMAAVRFGLRVMVGRARR